MKTRKTRNVGPNKTNYIVHLKEGIKTLCGRNILKLNISEDTSEREELCIICLNKFKKLSIQKVSH